MRLAPLLVRRRSRFVIGWGRIVRIDWHIEPRWTVFLYSIFTAPSLHKQDFKINSVVGRSFQTLVFIGTNCGLPRVKNTTPELSRQRVAKTYAPAQDGAKRFARRYGDQLVCVRHRLSQDGTVRYTTVELLVESTPVAPRARSVIAVRIPPMDKHTRTLLLACGAQWQPKEKYWLVPHLVAKNLRILRHRVPI